MKTLALVLPALLLIACAGSNEESDSWCDQPIRPEFAQFEQIEVSGDWFKVYKVGTNVYALAEPHNFQEVISYLILGEKEALLFDTGMGMASIATIVKELTRLPITVINSHTHYDHIGGNHEFDKILAMNTDYTRQRAANGMDHQTVAHEVKEEAFCKEKLPHFNAETYHINPFHITDFINDGSIIDLGGRTIEVISVPGHTVDAIALFDKQHGYLFTGDTFYEAPIWLFDDGTDLDQYQSSIEKMASFSAEINTLFPAHNTPTAPGKRLQELVSAFGQIMDGSKLPEPNKEDAHTDSQAMTYEFEHFSFIIRRDALEKKGILK